MKIDLQGRVGKDAFKFLKDNKADIIELKKSDIKLADVGHSWGGTSSTVAKSPDSTANKFLYENDTDNGILKRAIVVNTYNWLDSHDDVHLNNLFGKSIQERGKRILHLYDHKRELGAKVGEPIAWTEKTLAWKDLGVITPGNTQVLFLESKVMKRYNSNVYEMYLNDEIDQHSVGMRYIKFDLAVNEPDDKYYKDEYAVWQEVFPQLGNQQKADKGYFFAIREAVAIEGSAVLLGANELTPTLGNKFEPLKSTQPKVEPGKPLDVDRLLKSYLSN